jgi:hypothetical protein
MLNEAINGIHDVFSIFIRELSRRVPKILAKMVQVLLDLFTPSEILMNEATFEKGNDVGSLWFNYCWPYKARSGNI